MYNVNGIEDPHDDYRPYRTIGRPRMKWDYHVHAFCVHAWPHLPRRHWFDHLSRVDMCQYEDSFVTFLAGALV